MHERIWLQAKQIEWWQQLQNETLKRMRESGMDEKQIKYLTELLFGEQKNL